MFMVSIVQGKWGLVIRILCDALDVCYLLVECVLKLLGLGLIVIDRGRRCRAKNPRENREA